MAKHHYQLVKQVDTLEDLIGEVAEAIHGFQEIGFREYQSCTYLAETLQKYGFEITKGVAGLDTAFIALYRKGSGWPKIGFLAEYDALPGIGHACGHNLIAASAVGAAIALTSYNQFKNGTIIVFGTPAEESGGGKVVMAKAGLFTGVDCIFYFHPSVRDDLYGPTLACKTYEVVFIGQAAHLQVNPAGGKNALAAFMKLYSDTLLIEALSGGRVQIGKIISEGGQFPIVIPDRAKGQFLLSAPDEEELCRVDETFRTAANQAASLTGTVLTISEVIYYPSVVLNEELTAVIEKEMRYLGLNPQGPSLLPTSTDCGVVSRHCPFAGFRLALGDSLAPHTREFAAASISSSGLDKAIQATRIMCLSAWDVMTDTYILDKAREKWRGKFGQQ